MAQEHLIFQAKVLGDLQPSPFVNLAMQFQKVYRQHKSIACLIKNMEGMWLQNTFVKPPSRFFSIHHLQ